MTITVVTTWGDHQADAQGLSWVEGARAWPRDWRPVVYGPRPLGREWPNHITFRPERIGDVDDLAPPDNRRVTGRLPYFCWRDAERQNGYSFRTDARRFAWKVFALIHAADRILEPGLLVWLDADVRTVHSPPPDLWEQLVGDAALGYLDRPAAWAETGCLIIRLPTAWSFIGDLRQIYQPSRLYQEEQWHDGWIVSQLIRRNNYPYAKPIAATRESDVWTKCPGLARYFSHEKGFERKRLHRMKV